VEQVVTIFSNLVLSNKFVALVARHEDILRFLVLASSCALPNIQTTAMDVLIEISPYLSIPSSSPCPSPPTSPRVMYPSQLCETQYPLELMFRSMQSALMGEDRATVLKSEFVGLATY